MHENSRLLFVEHARPHFRSGMSVLEIGPDDFPSAYQRAVADSTITWHTLDLRDDDRLTYRNHDEYTFPIPTGSYDIVVSGNVIEHVRRIWVWIQEVARVCKPGGLVVTVNPVSWPYHEAPIDCWRAFPEAMKVLYEEASLEVLLSTWGTLEAPNARTRIPGRSLEYQPRRLRRLRRLLHRLGLPIECAYDTLTIGRKPARSVTA